MKKVLALLLVCLLMVGMMAGCAPGGKEASGDKTANTGKLKDVTLTYWMLAPGIQQDDDAVYAYLNEQLEEVLPNTQVEFVKVTSAEWADKWTKACAAGDEIDISWFGWFFDINDQVNMGALQPIDELLEEYGSDIVEYFGTDLLDIHRSSDNQLYFVPAWQGLTNNKIFFYTRQNAVDAVGQDLLDEMEKIYHENQFSPELQDVYNILDADEKYLTAAQDAGVLGLGAPAGAEVNLSTGKAVFDRIGAYVLYGDDTFTLQNDFKSETKKALYSYSARWYEAGLIREDAASTELWGFDWDVDGEDGYLYQKGGSQGYEDPANVIGNKYNIDCTGFYTITESEYITGFSTGTVIPATSKNPERAMMLMNLFFTEPGKPLYRTFVYGLEGEHFTYTDDAKETVELTNGFGEATPDWSYGCWAWTLGTCQFTFNTQAASKAIYDRYKAEEADARKLPTTAFAIDYSPVESEVAALQAVKEEYGKTLQMGILGANWEATYEEFLQKLDAAGMEKYLAELQNQLNAYVERTGVTW